MHPNSRNEARALLEKRDSRTAAISHASAENPRNAKSDITNCGCRFYPDYEVPKQNEAELPNPEPVEFRNAPVSVLVSVGISVRCVNVREAAGQKVRRKGVNNGDFRLAAS
jgi:hypothetical protein